MSNIPHLTLTPEAADKPEMEKVVEAVEEVRDFTMEVKEPEAPAVAVSPLENAQLTDAEKEAVEQFITQIDVTNTDHVLLYGADAQKKIAAFSDSALANVRAADTGAVGDILANLVTELKGFNADVEPPKNIFEKIFKGAGKQIEMIKAKYDKVEANVTTITDTLEGHQVQLLKDVAMFNRLYDENVDYFHELTMYIVAGDEKLKRVRETDLVELQNAAAASGDAMDAQKANDLSAMCDRFEKKLHDLKLTRQVSMQMAPQIRLLQNNDSMLVERIQSTISNTIPLWKSQMVLALGLHNSQAALKAQTAVTDMTNDLLRKNAETLKVGTIETAKEAERGIIDIETLMETNQSLIDTINEVMTIQKEGHEKRLSAEATLIKMEDELKGKLLELRH